MHFLIIMFELGLHGEIIVNSRRQEEQLIKKNLILLLILELVKLVEVRANWPGHHVNKKNYFFFLFLS
jgi:hypothetical protein